MKSFSNGAKGTIDIKDGNATIEFERYLSHPPKKIWEALTDPQQLSAWYICKVRIETGIGGKVELWFGKENYHVSGPIRVWDPPHTLEHEWNIEPNEVLVNGVNSTVRWDLIEQDEGTLLRLTHSNLAKSVVSGLVPWLDPAPADHLILDTLDAYLSSRSLPDVQENMPHLMDLYHNINGPKS